MQYTNRNGINQIETMYQLSDEGIVWQNEELSYNDISKIKLAFHATRFFGDYYTCNITSSKGKTLKLSSRKYLGIGKFEPQLSEYSAFVTHLHQRLDVNKVQFIGGKSKIAYFFEMIAALFGFIMVGLLLNGINKPVAIIFLAYVPFRLIPYFKKNFPIKYQPMTIPQKLMPNI